MVAHIAHSVLCARNRNNNNNTCKITMKVSDFILLNVLRLLLHLWFFQSSYEAETNRLGFWGGLKLKLNDNKLIIIHCLLRAIKTSFHAM